MMKKMCVLVLWLFLTPLVQAAAIETISKAQFGDKWIFIKEEVQLFCAASGGVYVINMGTLAQYPLNDIALEQAKSGKVMAQPLKLILAKNKVDTLTTTDLQPFLDRAETLCHSSQ